MGFQIIIIQEAAGNVISCINHLELDISFNSLQGHVRGNWSSLFCSKPRRQRQQEGTKQSLNKEKNGLACVLKYLFIFLCRSLQQNEMTKFYVFLEKATTAHFFVFHFKLSAGVTRDHDLGT